MTKHQPLFLRPKMRIGLALLVVPIAAVATTMGLAVYTPLGAVDRINLPILVFPLVWTALIFATLLIERPWRVATLLVALIAVNAVLVFFQLS